MAKTSRSALNGFDVTLESVVKAIMLLLGIALAVWVIYFAYVRPMPAKQHTNIVLTVGLAIYYFDEIKTMLAEGIETAREHLVAVSFLIIAVFMLAAGTYVHIHFDRWMEWGRIFQYNRTDLVVGAGVVATVIHATYREYGRVLGGVVVLTVIYALYGNYVPGMAGHSGLTIEQFIYRQSIALEGAYGFLTVLGATWIAIFVIMAGVIQGHKGFDYLLEIATAVADKTRSGIAQAAVISSMVIGSMIGGAAANVATTGSFTIPMMRDHGLSGRFAAAAESLASTGGQILPPIMSIAAFLMADFTGIPYATIAIAGVIPALIYFGIVSLSIHYFIVKEGIEVKAQPVDIDMEHQSSSRLDFYAQTLLYATPLLILIYLLMIARYPIMLTGFWSIVGFLAVRALYKAYQRGPVEYASQTVDGLALGARNLAPFMAILAGLGIIIDILTFAGVANRLATWIILFSGEQFVFVLLLAMLVSVLFGLGMPTPAAYIVVALILAPALTQVGLEQLSAHFYVFYFAVFSAITPPVAVAVAVAAGIGEADFLESCKYTFLLGGPVFLLPFFFVTNPEILYWEFPTTALLAFVFLVAVYALVNAVIGFNGVRRLVIWERLFAAAAAFLMAFLPDLQLQLLAAVLFLLYVVVNRTAVVQDIVAWRT